jgi:protein arginine kinase activator
MDEKCANCGAPAERRFTEIVGGRKRSMPLCGACASKEDFGPNPPPQKQLPKFKVKLKAQVLGTGLPATTLRCPECGIRLVELRKTGRVGCPHCYEVFRKQIMPLLKRIHGADSHEGSKPAGAGSDTDLVRLREELRRAIEAEDFEQAARLRDRIGATLQQEEHESGEDRE